MGTLKKGRGSLPFSQIVFECEVLYFIQVRVKTHLIEYGTFEKLGNYVYFQTVNLIHLFSEVRWNVSHSRGDLNLKKVTLVRSS